MRDCIAAAADDDTRAQVRVDRAAAAQRKDVETVGDYVGLTLLVAAHTPRTGEEAARVPAVADPERRSRRAAGEVVAGDAPEAVVDGAARGGEMAAAAVLPDAGREDGLDCGAVEAARAGAVDTRGAAAGDAAAAAQKAVAAAEVDEAADAGVGAGATRAGVDRGRARAMDGQQERERKTAVFWSPCPYRHATVRAASYYLPPSPFGSTGIVRCG